jgi:hypothetical protein
VGGDHAAAGIVERGGERQVQQFSDFAGVEDVLARVKDRIRELWSKAHESTELGLLNHQHTARPRGAAR